MNKPASVSTTDDSNRANAQRSIMNKTVLKVGGIVAIVIGAAALFVTGVTSEAVTAVVSAVFILAGLIAGVFADKK